MSAQKLRVASLICHTEPNTLLKEYWRKLKTRNRDAQKKRSSHKVRGVSSEAGRECLVGKICERKEVGLEPGVKERGSYGWWEWWVGSVRRWGRSENRQVRDRETGMRLPLIDSRDKVRHIERNNQNGWWCRVRSSVFCKVAFGVQEYELQSLRNWELRDCDNFHECQKKEWR